MKNKKTQASFTQVTNEFLIIPYQGHYVLYIGGELEGHYDSQEECLKVLKEKGIKYY